MTRSKKRAPRLDLNPSSADRWTTCTASPKYVFDNWAKVPPDTSTKFSRDGTTAHEVASALLQGREPDPANCESEIDADMHWHGWNYMEYVEGLKTSPESRILVERKMPLFYMPERNSIVDAAVINSDSLHIVDYKYGEGVIVNPENNLQATTYAVNVVHALIAERGGGQDQMPSDFPITIHIYQPRGRGAEDAPFHKWETTWAEIKLLAIDISLAATIIQGDFGSLLPLTEQRVKFRPSDKACQWCPAKGFCDERRKFLTQDIDALAVIEDDFPVLPIANTISVEQLGVILTHKPGIEKWLKDAKEYALGFMQGGGKIPGHKVVRSRGGDKEWCDEEEAKRLLLSSGLRKNEVITEKVLTPAAAEELLGKLNVELTNLITRSEGKPVIAPVDDKRNELTDVTSEFEVLEEDV